MHGLMNTAIQSFLHESFGAEVWHRVALRSGVLHELGPEGFEAMQTYEPRLGEAVLGAAAEVLGRPRESLLEDLGTFLISSPHLDPLRRLLRFGGVSFTDFLHSLDDLQGRTRLAVPELALPAFHLDEDGPGRFALACRGGPAGFGHVMVGVLRALADDYGALAVLEYRGSRPAGEVGATPSRGERCGRAAACATEEVIAIELYDPAFHAGRRFDLYAAELS